MRNRSHILKFTARLWFLAGMAVLFLLGCAHHRPLPQEPFTAVYQLQGNAMFNENALRWSPAFVTYDYARTYNRIGRPIVQQPLIGQQEVLIDVKEPVAYFMQRRFTTRKATYTNLIYRVHFPKVPYSLIPFNLTAGRNVGLIVVVTLDPENQPVLVTSVHTCGCYKAIVPTPYLPKDALPSDWHGDTLPVYGERLPAVLDFNFHESPQIVVYLRPEVHRVMDLKVVDREKLKVAPFKLVMTKMAPMNQLNQLPTETGTTSFYHTDGILKGHVKGSIKPLETLFMSLISLDLFVGTDKAYADPAETSNPFYTSLKPWRRQDSNMWDFARFLQYWGWRL